MRMVSWVALVLAGALLLGGCSGRRAAAPDAASDAAPAAVTNMQAAQFRDLLEDPKVTLINVHVPYEGRILDTDLELAFDRIKEEEQRLPSDRSAPIALYCMSGRMSEIAAQSLQEMGYSQIYNLTGGMLAWDEAGFPLKDWSR